MGTQNQGKRIARGPGASTRQKFEKRAAVARNPLPESQDTLVASIPRGRSRDVVRIVAQNTSANALAGAEYTDE